MQIDFKNIAYLEWGNERQRSAYNTLTQNDILAKLKPFDPILVGTIPINIDIENSDLDIICYCQDANYFKEALKHKFGGTKNFKIVEAGVDKHKTIVANFKIDCFEIEIFGQNVPTLQQNAYRHMVIEDRLLNEHGAAFRQKIIALKRQGYKTEPAFGILLELKGNPYIELLNYRC